ncbi:MAG: RNA-binding cell elongation regulator Jag/EloR [Anaerovoracaceae bacterium]
MDFSEKWGTDVDTAVNLALSDLRLNIEEVDVTVLEEPSRGFFGIGSKLALVRVEKKKTPVKEPVKKTVEVKVAKPEKKVEIIKETNEVVEQEKVVSPVQEKKFEKKPEPVKRVFVDRPVGDLSPCEDHAAISFLKEVTGKMGLTLDISAKENDENVYVDIQGKDSGTIIGKRGQTLDAIQYLTSLVVNKGNENYVRVVVDAENYRSKREITLEKLAERLADKVEKSGKSVRLEPMNPYERKVIHATLQNNPKVSTRSEGQDPYRRVIIELK